MTGSPLFQTEKKKCTHNKHTQRYTHIRQTATRTEALSCPTQPPDELRERLARGKTKARAFLSKLDTRFQLARLAEGWPRSSLHICMLTRGAATLRTHESVSTLAFECREHCPAFLRACTTRAGGTTRPSPSPQQPHPSGKPPSLPPSAPIGAKLAAWFGGKTEQRSEGPEGRHYSACPREGPPPGAAAARRSVSCCQETLPAGDTPGWPGSARSRIRHPTHLCQRQRSRETKETHAHTNTHQVRSEHRHLLQSQAKQPGWCVFR